MAQVRDMTRGTPWKLILTFALPLMLGNVFQQFYTMTDAAIVGQFLGVEALAALGAVEWLHWLMASVVQGFAQGFSILQAQKFGADDIEGLQKATGRSITLLLISTPVLMAGGILSAAPTLRLMNTPENIFSGALTYLNTYLCGLGFIAAHNFLASTLRALGNSKTPLYAMVIGAVFNIFADIFAIRVLNLGIFGAALATVLAQLLSALICLNAVLHIDILHLPKGSLSLRGEHLLTKHLLMLGMPMAFQNIVISVGGMVVQAIVNGFGFLYVAGFTATNKLYGTLEIAATGFGHAMATYTGQNLGAKQHKRIKTGLTSGVIMGTIVALLITAAGLVFGRSVLSLFITGEASQAAQVLEIAYRYLAIMCIFLPILYWLYVYRSVLQGMGDTVVPMLSGVSEFVMRAASVLLLPMLIGEAGIFWAEVAAWAGADVILIPACYRRIRQSRKMLPDSERRP